MRKFVVVDRPAVQVARITIDRADRRNALSIAVRDEVSDALDLLAGDDSVKVVVITANGDVFSAGFDLKEFGTAFDDPPFSARLWGSSDRFHHRLLSFPLPLIAGVNGPALAGGFDLAVCCDVRVASTTARFAHPEFLFGDIVYSPLHDLVGGGVARDLALTGRELDAEEALRLGLVSAVVEPDDLQAAVLEVAIRTTRAPRDKLLRTKAKAMSRAGITALPTLDL